MISEGLCDTEDWSNQEYILKYIYRKQLFYKITACTVFLIK